MGVYTHLMGTYTSIMGVYTRMMGDVFSSDGGDTRFMGVHSSDVGLYRHPSDGGLYSFYGSVHSYGGGYLLV